MVRWKNLIHRFLPKMRHAADETFYRIKVASLKKYTLKIISPVDILEVIRYISEVFQFVLATRSACIVFSFKCQYYTVLRNINIISIPKRGISILTSTETALTYIIMVVVLDSTKKIVEIVNVK